VGTTRKITLFKAGEHKDFKKGEFWREIPGYAEIDKDTFYDDKWQMKKSVTRVSALKEVLGSLVDDEFIESVETSLKNVPMSIRIPPYIMALIDWSNPHTDPLRRQFLPVASSNFYENHPNVTLDSLNEVADSPVPGLTHRYSDKALFLATKICPLYCRYCTRSYAVGSDTDQVKKYQIKSNSKAWEAAFEYIRNTPTIEDVVISGGDSYMLKASHLDTIINTLLDIPHIRRMRVATRGPAVMPMKLLTDVEWTEALINGVERGRSLMKDVVLHTHFNHANEITDVTEQAMNVLFKAGVKVRNQSVLLRGVNDTVEDMQLLVKRLSYLNVQPYYVFQHDLVEGVEELRTTLRTAIEIEKGVRGMTAGFNTPGFIVDAPGGGGKRTAASYEYYDEVMGVSAYRSPNIDDDKLYFYFDPIHLLPAEGRERWKIPGEGDRIVEEVRSKVLAQRNGIKESFDFASEGIQTS
jgi:lysine 2,3-aminomutase